MAIKQRLLNISTNTGFKNTNRYFFIKETINYIMAIRWDHTEEERRLIKQFGGIPLKKYGYDGTIRGRPVEVRSARVDDRFRIQKDVHQNLVRNNGSYILKAPNLPAKRVPAKVVSKKIGGGKWFKDRTYPHKFLRLKDVF